VDRPGGETGVPWSLERLVTDGPVALFVKDRGGRYLEANRAFLDLLPVTTDSVRGRVDRDLFPADVAATREALDAEVARTGRPHQADEVLTARGEARVFLTTRHPLVDRDGTPCGTWGVSVDITGRSRADDLLRRDETRLRGIFENSVDAIAVTCGGRHVVVNPAYAAMFGYGDPAELLAVATEALIAPSERPRVARFIRGRVRGDPVPSAYETLGLRRDGTVFPMDVRVSGFTLGGTFHTLEILRDISERRDAERERHRLEAQLRQAQKMEVVGQLAGGIAHDFNNLLMAITGSVALARMDLEPSHPATAMLAQVDRATHSAAALTRQLLAFSRRQVIAPKTLELSALVVELRNLLARLLGENVVVDHVKPMPSWPVKVDANQFEQVLANLAVNARDAMPSGGRLTIRVDNVAVGDESRTFLLPGPPGEYVCLTVADTGLGMTEDVRRHMFEPFFTTKEKGRGTGLGLATVYGVVQQHLGLIDVTSGTGEGTTFRVFLPRAGGPLEPVPLAQDPSAPLVRGTETILLVEDEEMVLQSVEGMLRRLGYRVLRAATPQQALAMASDYDGEIHALVTDVVMPGMNGRELAMRVLASRPDTRVLFTSGHADSEVARAGVLSRGLNFLPKPYQAQQLAFMLRDVLGDR
jgi:PAS domain S-box-containing protein